VNDEALDPLADDVATLALDLKLAEAGWTRRAANLFLAGYGSETPTAASAQETV
jgi:formate dehydrogenase maturation protein FdhE